MGINDIYVDLYIKESINLIVEDENEDRHLLSLIIDCRKLLIEFER